MMNNDDIRNKLVDRGKELFNAPKKVVAFTNDKEADMLINDIKQYPHAFVLACVMDRQIKAEKAWLIPYFIYKKIGDFSMETLNDLSKEDVHRIMSEPEPLHRFVNDMSDNLYSAIQRIKNVYDNDASKIWEGKLSSAEVVYRFLEFEGVGPKIATMAANILSREFKISFADYFAIDISADVHVRRVFSRLGLCPNDASVEQIVYKAKALHPEFPGMMDMPCWEIGRNWCKPHNPLCNDCYMNDVCQTANTNKA